MTLRAALEITGDSDDAQKAVADLDKTLDDSEEAFKAQAKAAKEAEEALKGAAGAAKRAGEEAAGAGRKTRGGGEQALPPLKLTNAQLQNMQFQLQDIAVGLASGQSPFTVIAQQGSQLVQIFGPRAGVVGALRAFGTGIAAFVTNPLNLAVLSAALAGGAMQLLANRFLSGAGAAEEQAEKVTTLKEAIAELDRVSGRANKTQEERLRLAEDNARRLLEEEIATRNLTKARLEGARAQLRSQIERSRTPGVAADISGVGVLGTQRRIEDLTKQLEAQEAALREAEAALRGAVAARIKNDVEASLDPVRAATRDYEEATAKLRSAFSEREGEATDAERQELAAGLDTLARERDAAIEAARNAQGTQRRQGTQRGVSRGYDGARRSVDNLLSAQRAELAVLREADPVKRELIRLSSEYAAATTAERLLIEQNVTAIQAETAARRDAEAAQRAEDRAAGVIDSLQTELDLLQAADPVQRELIGLREELAGATAAQRDEIIALVGAMEQERAAQEQADAALRAAGAGYDYLRRSAAGALHAIIVGGQSAGDVMKNLAVQIAAAAAQAVLIGSGPLSGLFAGGGGFGGGGGGDVGGLIGRLFGGGRAAGGPVEAGKYYLVGERGPELFAPSRSGAVIPNAASLARSAPPGGFGGPGGGRGVIQIIVSGARGDREIETLVERGVRRGIAVYDSNMPLRVRQIADDPRLV